MSLATRLTAFAQAVGADIKSLNSKIPYKGDWNAVTVYKKGDLVWYSNDLWLAVANISGAGDYPSTDSPSVWRLVTEAMSIGGDEGQILAKASDVSFDTTWIDPPTGGGVMAGTFSKLVRPTADWGIPTSATQVPGLTVTVPADGDYVVMFTADLTTFPAEGYNIGYVAKNGVIIAGAPAAVKQTFAGTFTERRMFNKQWLVTAAAGDILSIQMTGNGNINNNLSAAHTSMMVFRPGGTKGDKGDTGGNAVIPLEGWHTVGQAGEPAYQGAWGVGNQAIKFRKDPFGKVELIGSPTGGVSGTVIFTLPVGYRPANSGYHDCLLGGGGATYVNIDAATGNVTSGFGASGAWLNNIHFDTGLVTTMPSGPQGPQGVPGNTITVPIDPWHTVGQPGEPALNAGFSMLDTVQFRKDPLGVVHMRGSFAAAPGSSAFAFTLPVGYRPPQRYRGIAIQNQVAPGQWEGQVNVNTDGTVAVYYTGSGATCYVSVDQIEFDTGTVTAMPTGPQGPKGDTGGIDSYTTLNWNTATTPGFYRSTNNPLERTINGPGDTLNPPPQSGIVVDHQAGYIVQRVWDLSTKIGWTRHRSYDNTWTAWAADLTKPDLWVDVMAGPGGGFSPKDGDERYFQNATMKFYGVMWKFRYNAAAPAGKPKWEFVGGQGVYDLHDGDNFATPANTWVDAGPVGPGFIIPLPGDYTVEFGGRIYSNIPGVYAQIGVSVNGVVDGHTVLHGNFGGGYIDYEDQSRTSRIENVAQGVMMKLVYNSNPAGGGFQTRWMRITPIRVSM